MLAPRVREDIGGVVVDHFDIGDQRGTRIQALEEIVRQQRVLGHPPADRRLEGVDVVQALAGEEAGAEQVLIGIRDRRRVGIDAGVAGVDPRKERAGGTRQVDGDARLKDAVALGDLAQGGIDDRPVEGVRQNPDQGAGGVARQPGVGIEGEDEAHRRQDRKISDLDGEAAFSDRAQAAVELLDLPPLALPTHEDALLRIPLAIAVQEEEAVVTGGEVPAVEPLDAGDRRGQDLLIALHRGRSRVLEVGEEGEVDARVEIAQRLHFEVGDEAIDLVDAADQDGYDHQRAEAFGDAVPEIEAREPAWHHECRHDALDDEHRELARGNERE